MAAPQLLMPPISIVTPAGEGNAKSRGLSLMDPLRPPGIQGTSPYFGRRRQHHATLYSQTSGIVLSLLYVVAVIWTRGLLAYALAVVMNTTCRTVVPRSQLASCSAPSISIFFGGDVRLVRDCRAVLSGYELHGPQGAEMRCFLPCSCDPGDEGPRSWFRRRFSLDRSGLHD